MKPPTRKKSAKKASKPERLPVVITGASSGIGMSFAREMSSMGHPLIIAARRTDRLRELARELSSNTAPVTVVAADLSTANGIKRLERAIETAGGAEGLIHAAGFGTWGHFVSVRPDAIFAQVDCHCRAAAALARSVLPRMIERGGGFVILISSMASFYTTSNFTHYSATKAYLNMLCRGLADELRGTGVKIQALCPGLTKTEFLDADTFNALKLDRLPPSAWMSADEVVAESLDALERGRVIFVPGWKNRAFMRMMNAPVIGPLTGAIIGALGRRSGML